MNNDLISREALKKAIKDTFDYASATGFSRKMANIKSIDLVCMIFRIIDNAPTVDTTFKEVVAYECGQKSVERPHGEWLHPYVTDIACECSICHVQMPTHRFNFCPNCGADMRKEAEHD